MSIDNSTPEASPEGLKPLADAVDAYEATALWWSNLILNPKFRSGSKSMEWGLVELTAQSNALQNRPEILRKIGRFAETLTEVTRNEEIDTISIEYNVPPIFVRVSEEVGLSYSSHDTFPWKSISIIDLEEGTASGRPGGKLEWQPIWPPQQASTT